MKAFIGGAWREITSAKVVIAGAWRTVTRGVLYKDSAWHDAASFLAPLTVSVFPATVSGSGFGNAPQTITTEPTTATPSGGLAPYTYSWQIESSSGPAVTATNPTLATTAFRISAPIGEVFETAGASVTVTDARGATATGFVDMAFQKTT